MTIAAKTNANGRSEEDAPTCAPCSTWLPLLPLDSILCSSRFMNVSSAQRSPSKWQSPPSCENSSFTLIVCSNHLLPLPNNNLQKPVSKKHSCWRVTLHGTRRRAKRSQVTVFRFG